MSLRTSVVFINFFCKHLWTNGQISFVDKLLCTKLSKVIILKQTNKLISIFDIYCFFSWNQI